MINLKHTFNMSALKFIVISTIVNLVLYHQPLYQFSINNLDISSTHGILTFITLLVLIAMLTFILLALIAMISHWLLKIFCIITIFINTVAVYFIGTYHVIIDKSMIGNILNTDVNEAGDFFHYKLLIYIFFMAIIPSFLIIKTTIKKSKRTQLLAYIIGVFIVAIAWIYMNANTWLWFDKYGKKLGGNIMPWSYIVNTIRYQNEQNKLSQIQILLPNATHLDHEKTVVMLIIGESARAKNFSLYGYKKNTNPLLAKQNLTILKNATSCGTYTTKSVECILSHQKPTTFGDKFEPLPSYLQRNGVEVIWRTTNWGEPKIKVSSYQKRGELEKLCTKNCGYDEVLLGGLQEQIEQSKANKIFVVLHQSGSHGPSYSKKYPQQFKKFTPTCDTVELSKCSKKELINAYDNTILYTDYFINQAIELLKKTDRKSMLMYLSDHGESLGEKGLYLHGTPLSIAPKEQFKIPFLVWLSSEFDNTRMIKQDIDMQDIDNSQQLVFHTIMSAFNMRSDIFNNKLNLLQKQ